MFAYSWPGRRPGSQVWNGLHYLVREPPFSTAQLVDVDYSIGFAQHTTPKDRIAVITTKPLTSEYGWKELKKGQLLMFDKGCALQYTKLL
jgi:glutamine amidotransferase